MVLLNFEITQNILHHILTCHKQTFNLGNNDCFWNAENFSAQYVLLDV